MAMRIQDTRAIMGRAGEEVNAYLKDEIERHRQQRQDDLISAMLEMSDMTDQEIGSAAVLLLLAGFDTTAKLIGNSLVALAMHPDQRRIVVDDLSLVPDAIEEVLRWMGVSQMTVRRVVEDTVIASTGIVRGRCGFSDVRCRKPRSVSLEEPSGVQYPARGQVSSRARIRTASLSGSPSGKARNESGARASPQNRSRIHSPRHRLRISVLRQRT